MSPAPAVAHEVTCHECGRTHPAEYSHEGRYGEGPIYAVVCDADHLTDYYTAYAVREVPAMSTETVPTAADGTTVIEYGGHLCWKASTGELWTVPLSHKPGSDDPFTVSEWDAEVNAGPPEWWAIEEDLATALAAVAAQLGASGGPA